MKKLICWFLALLPLITNIDLTSSPACYAASSDRSNGATGVTKHLQLNYPKDSQVITASATFLIGAVAPNATVKCNGLPVRVNSKGFFAHVVSLKPGLNNFNLVSNSHPDETLSVTVRRQTNPKPLPEHPLMFAPESAEPQEDLGVTPGDVIGFAIRGTPASSVNVYLGKQMIKLAETRSASKPRSFTVHRKVEVAYGLPTKIQPSNLPDLYLGYYRVSKNNHWHAVRPKFVLAKGSRTIKYEARCRLSVVHEPSLVETIHEDTVTRLGPGEARTTPLGPGIRLLVDGWQGNSMRCSLAPGQHIWIAKEDLAFKEGPPVESAIKTVNIQEEGRQARIIIPLSQRLPYQIEQQLNPNRLILKIFGATSDTDWITQTPPQSGKGLIDHVTWKQPSDQVYELVIEIKSNRQWGFWANYAGTSLIVHVKGPPELLKGLKPLSGLTVCLDPGHGGQEKGALGPSGVSESEVNLSIARDLRTLLENEGARVIMTRQSPEEEPSLQDRVKTAIDGGANLLISIHNNALPDGRDPWAEHGTSCYWYHSQSLDLAKVLKAHLVAKLGFPDFGTFYQNLALARPSQMPAVLVEVGFMIHPDEYAELLSPDVQQRAADALLQGIQDYLLSPTDRSPRNIGG